MSTLLHGSVPQRGAFKEITCAVDGKRNEVIPLKTSLSLSGNQLKILALIFMTVDHIGVQLFPQALWMRAVGRLALPIFAYMIAEGCRFTRSRGKYLGTVALFALLCQVVYLVAERSLYQCILVTFTLSILLIFAVDGALRRRGPLEITFLAGAFIFVAFICEGLPHILTGTDFSVDYGLWGVLLPVFFYLGRTKKERMLLGGMGLVLLAANSAPVQWLSLLSLPFLALYSGHRGKLKLKYLFYIYYPLHLAVIYLISTVI